MGKKRIIKKITQLPDDIVQLVEEKYPDGYEEDLISFQMPDGELATALPLETDDAFYLIKMPNDSVLVEDDEPDDSTSASDEIVNLEKLEIADEDSDDDD